MSNDWKKSFDTLKQALSEAPVLAFPLFDLPFLLDTDVCTTGVAAVLSQVQDGQKRLVAHAAKAQIVSRLDHRSLLWLQTFKQPKPQEARRVEYVLQFDMKIEHRGAREQPKDKAPECGTALAESRQETP